MQNSLTLRNKYSSIQLQKQGNGNLVFNYYTGSLIQPTNTPVFMDLEQGRVGIGTSSPASKLDVSSGGKVATFGLAGSGGDNYIQFRGNSNNFDVGVTGTSWGVADSGVAYRLIVTQAGNVGIGTTSPSQKLDVYGVAVFGTNTGRYTTIGGSSGTMYTQGEAGGWAFGHHAKGSSGTDRGGFGWLGSSNDISYYYIGAAYNTATMYITSGSNGAVGIGTASPTARLTVSGSVHLGSYSSLNTVNIENRTGKGIFTISTDGVNNAGGTTLTYSWSDGGHGPLKFNNASNEVMRLTAAGNVGIGTSNPTLGTLQVNGNVHATSFTGSLFGTASWASNAVTATTANSATSATTSTTSTTLASDDNRTISPNELAIGRMGFGFTSWTNNNSSPWADYLHLRSYIDSSGGNDNLVMFRKDAIGMRIYQQTFGSSTAYSSFKDVAWTDGTNATGTWGVSITGTATNASSASVTDTTTGTGPYYLMFADGTTGNRVVRVDSSTLQFNATTNTLTVPNLAGTASLATTASFATTANNVNITTQDTTPVTFNVTFVGSSTGANTLNVDTTALRYTPSTSTFETPIVNSTTAVRGGNGSASAPAFSFSGDTDNGMYYVGTNSIGLATAGTARVVIDSSGNVGVKATTMVRDFQVGGFSGNPEICIGSGTTGTGAISFGDGATGNDPWRGYIQYNHSSDYMFFGTTNANRLQITSAGAMGLGIAPTNTSGRFEASNDIVAYSSSDKNWKKNIKNIDSPLEKLSQINGVEFDWIEDEPVHGNKGHDIGVIAQEIEQVLPEIVQTRESGMKAVQYDKIIPLLVECIKDQQKQIEELKQIVNGITR